MNELEALLALSFIPTFGGTKIRQMLKAFGSASAAFQAEAKEIEELIGLTEKFDEAWESRKSNRSEKELALAKSMGVKIIPFYSPLYPKRLSELWDAPLLLYVLGELKTEDLNGIAIVGTRAASIYGLEMAEKFGKELAASQVTVVSGLARGIDTAAHVGALKTGRTLAVIGSGLAHLYPPENKKLAEEIAKKGAVISEFHLNALPEKYHFPMRNRIVSGITRGTLLIEAPLKSGALITVKLARSQGKPVFALPGRVDNENFQGNHHLIKTGEAKLVENGSDVLSHFEDLFPATGKIEPLKKVHLDPEEQVFLNQWPSEEITLETVEQLTKLPIKKINVLLMRLQLKQAVKEYPGKIYKKIA